ncbi:MAG: glycosyltransferase family 2 protein [Myxococcales bacterium]|nr:glycosyltransferase family 2 protein [Myxococcales bacterium]
MKLSVVIPCYNESETIVALLNAVQNTPYTKEIIVVDDGSTDGTREILSKYGQMNPSVRVILQPQNMGKGAALRTGFGLATGDIVVVQDADLEYNPKDYAILLQPILEGKADVVYGSRFQGGPGRVLYFKHMLGNRFLTFLSNLLTDLNLTDMETCYKVFRREVIQNIVIVSNRFGFEPEVTAKVAKMKDVVIYEVPISYNGRTYAEGKKITWKDGAAALWHIIRFNLDPFAEKNYVRPSSDLPSLVMNQRKEFVKKYGDGLGGGDFVPHARKKTE